MKHRQAKAFLHALEVLCNKYGFEIRANHPDAWIDIFDKDGLRVLDVRRITRTEGAYDLQFGPNYR